ncbi:MAG: hypothetical protein BGO12_16365 [Verrucomicrobia bacterium 61-8]|nr:hypothetical protein [Verrucomicrobiota bacterium]OJV16129.1 MAG: hypothetical protein BGO12_16365 [Verrucomicrobia bacterium 61-8]
MSCPEPSTEHSPRPSATHRLRRKAAWSLRASIITGFLALALFVLTTVLLLGCFLTRIDPFAHRAAVLYLALAAPSLPVLAFASWLFSIRHDTLLRMANEKRPASDP